jgi:Fur family ferric uptake transcriptional regulator
LSEEFKVLQYARGNMIRNDILSALQTHHTLSALDLITQLKKKRSSINKTSIYRALDQLIADSLICKQNFDGKEFLYELKYHHHDHLLCISCGEVQTTPCKTSKLPETIDGFQIDHHHLTYYGYCKNCQKK